MTLDKSGALILVHQLFTRNQAKARTNKLECRMESATFRKWLAERGCHFDHHEHQRGDGPVMVTVQREGRKAEVPLNGSRQSLDAHVVEQACIELGLDPTQLPGPKSRV